MWSRAFPAISLSAVLVTVLAFAVFPPRTASAHAVQVGAEPAPNSQLAQSPQQISVTFSEDVEISVTTVQLFDQQANEIPLGSLSFPSSTQVSAAVPQELSMGIYTAVWRNLSKVDGHTWAGSYTFVMLGPNGEAPTGSAPPQLKSIANLPSTNPDTLETAARWLVLLGSATLLGGAAYVLFIAFPAAGTLSEQPASSLRSLSTSILLVTGAIAVFLVAQGSALQLMIQADHLGGLSRVDTILKDTRLGHFLIARQVMLLISLATLGLLWRARSTIGTSAAFVLLLATGIGVLLTQSMVSHAAAGEGSFWKTSADFLHLLAAAFWVGGLIHVGLSMPRWLDEAKGAPRTLFAAESFRRFSLLAAISVLVLMISGVLSALAQFSTFSDLWSSSYGWSLVGKMSAMLPLLAVAGLNAFVLQPLVIEASLQMRGGAVDEGDVPPAAARLQRLLVQSVRVEAVLALVVLIAVAVLIQLEPPRAAAAAKAASGTGATASPEDGRGYYLKANQEGGLVVSLKVDPAQVGLNTFEIGLGSEFGNIGEILLTRLDFNYKDAALGQSQLDLPLAGSAKFSADGSNLSRPGEWDVTATIRRRGGDDVRTTFSVPIADPNAASASGGRWGWPFEGARSTGAIVALIAGGVLAVGVRVWQGWSLRRGRRT